MTRIVCSCDSFKKTLKIKERIILKYLYLFIISFSILSCSSSKRKTNPTEPETNQPNKQTGEANNTPSTETKEVYYGIVTNCANGTGALAYPDHPKTISQTCSKIFEANYKQDIESLISNYLSKECLEILQTETTVDEKKVEYYYPPKSFISTNQPEVYNFRVTLDAFQGKLIMVSGEK